MGGLFHGTQGDGSFVLWCRVLRFGFVAILAHSAKEPSPCVPITLPV